MAIPVVRLIARGMYVQIWLVMQGGMTSLIPWRAAHAARLAVREGEKWARS
jgi:hypothetical protein